ncbi:FtsX-like permease family protein [Adlercreutzia murintestinalis]|uniref:FtsX-like permease family protein n=1 Tax=Adlercreutzia murintestinalis TaxID=2941325 RepID=UPI00203DA544|nr:FtsX-like permease family protein [Adlercreutzia murintestinalis]
MLVKLACRNIRHSVRDYTIYFLTLLFGVAVFYAFNSVGSQQILFDIESQADADMFKQTQGFLSMFSALIAGVLGFLILYSNGFLIRRRKREFGTYMLLGMPAGQVSCVMLIETVLVGLLSLVVGLVLGFLLSQAMSFFTAALFGATISNYQFVFSPLAVQMTVLCFVGIYVVVALFNTFTVNRQKLIDLLHANAKNQKVTVRNPWVCLVVFVVSLGILAYAYEELIASGMVMLDDPQFIRATICMLVGTFLFFWSLAGFVIAVLTRARGVYLCGLVPFTVRQIASRVNTAFLSLWIVCILLFFSVTVFSVGMGLVQVLTGNIEAANPYSATLIGQVYADSAVSSVYDQSTAIDQRAKAMQAEAPERYEQGMAYDWDMATVLRANAPELWAQTIAASAQLDTYDAVGVTYGSLFDHIDPAIAAHMSELSDHIAESNIVVVKLSQVNAVRALTGQSALDLGAGECLIANNMEITKEVAADIAANQLSIDVMGRPLTYRNEVVDTQFQNNALLATALVTVVPDAVVDELIAAGAIPLQCWLDVMYADNGNTEVANDEALNQIVAASQPSDLPGFDRGFAGRNAAYASLLWPVTSIYTAHEMTTQSGGLKMLITYLAIYIGFIFLIATAAILAVQQLSQTTDSLPRYRMLSRIGCSQRALNRSLLVQVLVYFLLPLSVALCHTACAVGVISEKLFTVMGVPVAGPIALAAVLVLVVYGGYLLATYLTSRSAVNASLKAS